jgi:cytochrome c biogenesis protein CcdA
MLEDFLRSAETQLVMLALVYVLILAFIFLDLWAGVRKAKKKGVFRSSHGYRQTLEKIAKYYNAIFVLTVIDVVQMCAVYQLNYQCNSSIPQIPIMTFIGAIFIGFIELKSVYEKSEQKDKAKIADTAKLLEEMMEKSLKEHSPEEIITAFNAYLTDKNKEKKE